MARCSSNKPKPLVVAAGGQRHSSQKRLAANTQQSITSGEEFSLQDVEDEDEPDLPVTTKTKALDIHYFFTEVESPTADSMKVVQKACNICIKSYSADKDKAPKNSPNYFYTKSTGILNLCCHLKNPHCTEYDLAAAKYNWPPKLLSQSGVASTHKDDRKLRNPDIPLFSPSSFLDHLACFIIADDQSIRVVKCPEF
ncbi:hypothetical protein EDB89DRAFT_2078789 [Lactarius sanguifluus]|nr:hypothetical protein EDB89DRAFT_2078789 [Lactarius sanguifluus]